jgi:hypothetical protein
MGRLISLMGHRSGLLQVVEHAGFNDARQSLYRCECRCGEFTAVRGTDLASRAMRRCGPDCKAELPKSRAMFQVIGRGTTETHFG